MHRPSVRLSILLLAPLLVLPACAGTAQHGQFAPTTVWLDHPAWFTAPDGDLVLVEEGAWQVNDEGDRGLRLTPEAGGRGRVVVAMERMHDGALEFPRALVSRTGENGETRVALLRPGGFAREALGRPEAIRERGLPAVGDRLSLDEKPDLVVGEITVIPDDVTVGEAMQVGVTVVNRGTAAAEGVTLDVTVLDDTGAVLNRFERIWRGVDSHAWRSESFDRAPLPDGEYRLRARVRCSEATPELESGNNGRQRTFSVSRGRPDLRATFFGENPGYPDLGGFIELDHRTNFGEITFTMRMFNGGQSAAVFPPGSRIFHFEIRQDGEDGEVVPVDFELTGDRSGPDPLVLESGAEHQCEVKGVIPEGRFAAVFVMDPDDVIRESLTWSDTPHFGEDNTHWKVFSAEGPATVDLVVVDVELLPETDPIHTFQVVPGRLTLRNEGNDEVDLGDVNLRCDSPVGVPGEFPVEGVLGPGEEIVHEICVYSREPGVQTLTWEVNYTAAIRETTRLNNKGSVDVRFVESPSLKLESIEVPSLTFDGMDGGLHYRLQGDWVQTEIRVTIRNEGAAAARFPPGSRVGSLVLSGVEGTEALELGPGWRAADVVTVGAGESITLTATVPAGALTPGGLSIVATADPDMVNWNPFRERADRELGIQVTGRPDLVITHLETQPEEPVAGESFLILVSVTNRGTAHFWQEGSYSFTTFPTGRRYLSVAPSGYEAVAGTSGNGVTFPPGETKVLHVPVGTNVEVGTETWTLVVDPYDTCREIDETNNTATIEITVKPE